MAFDVKMADPQPAFDKKFIVVGCGLLIIAVVFFTWLHWIHPEVLRVPSNSDVTTWKNPAFNQTLIYKRMTPEERTKVLTEGIPDRNLGTLFFMEIFSISVALLCFVHARKHWGDWMAYTFLLGSFIFTGLQESMWILFGRFTGMSSGPGLGEEVFGTYWFTKGFFWFIETPVAACLGWFYIAYTCVWVAGKVFPKTGLWGRAAIGGLIAVGFDLWQDPVVVSPEMMSWVWAQQDVIHFLGIPQSNFAGWFLLIFIFAVLWEQLPKWEKKWGRAGTTWRFFVSLFILDLGILAYMAVSSFIIRTILIVMGVDHTVTWPNGW